ncbi:GGDEF domain-containing protein [Rhodanobacter hydrolyticus]|uniref:diguanylate cyclase n=1 Tax=Rhodanobacter hydrolyticus TaxID=2250595 RepID=A0ABW8J9H2_9GAMM
MSTPAAHAEAVPATLPAQVAPTPIHAEVPANPSQRPLPWLLLLALAGALLAWWASLRRSRQLHAEAERLVRQQRFLKSAHSHLRQKSEQLQQLSMHDPLTGTLNRQAFAAELRERIDHLAKYNQPLSLIVFDLDHFKAINDSHGHLVGDAALALVVGVVREHLVSDDLFGRFGGDEFMIACAGHHVAHAMALAEQLRAAVAARAPLAEPPIPDLTLSLGVAQADPDHGYHPDELFARADAALYAAKQGGRNRVAADVPVEAASGAIRRHL